MYNLLVFCGASVKPVARVEIESAANVLAAIPQIMKDHEGCERVEVHHGGRRLFSVDCDGNTHAG